MSDNEETTETFQPPVEVSPNLFSFQAGDLNSLIGWMVNGLKSNHARLCTAEAREFVSPDALAAALSQQPQPPEEGWAAHSALQQLQESTSARLDALEQVNPTPEPAPPATPPPAPGPVDDARISALEARLAELEARPAPEPAASPAPAVAAPVVTGENGALLEYVEQIRLELVAHKKATEEALQDVNRAAHDNGNMIGQLESTVDKLQAELAEHAAAAASASELLAGIQDQLGSLDSGSSAPVVLPAMDTSETDGLKEALAQFQKTVDSKTDASALDLLDKKVVRLQELVNTKARNDELGRLELGMKKGFEKSVTQDQMFGQMKEVREKQAAEAAQSKKAIGALEKKLMGLGMTLKKVEPTRIDKLEKKTEGIVRDLAKLSGRPTPVVTTAAPAAPAAPETPDVEAPEEPVAVVAEPANSYQMDGFEGKLHQLQKQVAMLEGETSAVRSSHEEVADSLASFQNNTGRSLTKMSETLLKLQTDMMLKVDQETIDSILSAGGNMAGEPSPGSPAPASDGGNNAAIAGMQQQLAMLRSQLSAVQTQIEDKATKSTVASEIEHVRQAVFASLGADDSGKNQAGCMVARVDRLEQQSSELQAGLHALNGSTSAAARAGLIGDIARGDTSTDSTHEQIEMLSQSVATRFAELQIQLKTLKMPTTATKAMSSEPLDGWTLRQLVARVNSLAGSLNSQQSLLAAHQSALNETAEGIRVGSLKTDAFGRRLKKVEVDMKAVKQDLAEHGEAAPVSTGPAGGMSLQDMRELESKLMEKMKKIPNEGEEVKKLAVEVDKMRHGLETLKEAFENQETNEYEVPAATNLVIREGDLNVELVNTIKAMTRTVNHHSKVQNGHQQEISLMKNELSHKVEMDTIEKQTDEIEACNEQILLLAKHLDGTHSTITAIQGDVEKLRKSKAEKNAVRQLESDLALLETGKSHRSPVGGKPAVSGGAASFTEEDEKRLVDLETQTKKIEAWLIKACKGVILLAGGPSEALEVRKAVNGAQERSGKNGEGVVPLSGITLPTVESPEEPLQGELQSLDVWTELQHDWDLAVSCKQLTAKGAHLLVVQLTEQLGDVLYHVGRHEKQLQHKADRTELIELARSADRQDTNPMDRMAALSNIAISKGGTAMCMSCLRRVHVGQEHHHTHKNHDTASMMRNSRNNKAVADKRGAIVKGTSQHEVPPHLTYPGLGRKSNKRSTKVPSPDIPPLIREELLEWSHEDDPYAESLGATHLPPIFESRQLSGTGQSFEV